MSLDRAMAARLDAWITREPDWDVDEPRVIRCQCGAFLPQKPERTEEWEDAHQCDGKPTPFTHTYNAHDDAGILDIIGWSHEGESWEGMNPAFCGLEEEHAPHKVVMWAGITNIWTCRRCGQEHRESEG